MIFLFRLSIVVFISIYSVQAFSIDEEIYYKTKAEALEAVSEREELQHVSESLRNDKDVVLKAIRTDSNSFEYASDSLKKDKGFILSIIKNHSYIFKYVHSSLKNDKEFIIKALNVAPRIFHHADISLRNDKPFVMSMIKDISPNVITAVGDDLVSDKELVLAAVKRNGDLLRFLKDKDFTDDEDIAFAAVKCTASVYQYVSPRLHAKKTLALELLQKKGNGFYFKYADKSLKNDNDIVMAVLANSGSSLEHVNPRFRKNREAVLLAVKASGLALRFADNELRKDLEVVTAALRSYHGSYAYIDESLKKNRELALLAINKSGFNLKHMDFKFRQDKEIVLIALKKHVKAIEFVDDSLLVDEEILKIIKNSEHSAYALKYIKKRSIASKQLALSRPVLLALVPEGEKLKAHPNMPKDLSTSIIGRFAFVDISYSPDGLLIATAGVDRTVKLWDANTLTLIHTFSGHKREVNAIAFSPSGKLLASASNDDTFKLWDIEKKELVYSYEDEGVDIEDVAFSSDGKYLAYSVDGNYIGIWDIENKERLTSISEHKDTALSIAFNPDGQQFAFAGKDKNIILMTDYKDENTYFKFIGHSKKINSIAFSPNGKLIVSAALDGLIKIWDVKSQTLATTLHGHKTEVGSVVFSKDGKKLASASLDGSVKLWDLGNYSLIHSFNGFWDSKDTKKDQLQVQDVVRFYDMPRSTNGVHSVAFSPDGNRLVATFQDETIKQWDANNYALLNTSVSHRKVISYISSSQNGKLLAHAADKFVYLWKVNKHSLKSVFEHPVTVNSLSVNHDGSLLAVATRSSIFVWDTLNNKLLHVLNNEYVIGKIAISPDSKTIASSSDEGFTRIWDVKTGKRLQTFTGQSRRRYDDASNDIKFSPDGKFLAVVSKLHVKLLATDDYSLIKTWDKEEIILNNKEKSKTKEEEIIKSVFFNSNSSSLSYVTSGGRFITKQLKTQQNMKKIPNKQLHKTNKLNIYPLSFALAPNKKTYIQTEISFSDLSKMKLFLRDFKSNKIISTQQLSFPISNGSSTYTADSKYIIFDNGDHRLKRWNVETLEVTDSIFGGASGNWLWQSMQSGIFWRGDDGSLLSQSKIKQVAVPAH